MVLNNSRIVYFALLLIAFVALFFSLRQGHSDLKMHALQQDIQRTKHSIASRSLSLEDDLLKEQIERILAQSENPQYMYSIANFYAWLSYVAKVQLGKDKLGSTYSEKAYQLNEKSRTLRPFDSAIYSALAKDAWRLGKDRVIIENWLDVAQKLGPYERVTSLTSVEYYLAHWPTLNKEQQKKVVSYLLEMDDFNLNEGDFWSILTQPVLKSRFCSIMRFNAQKFGACQ